MLPGLRCERAADGQALIVRRRALAALSFLAAALWNGVARHVEARKSFAAQEKSGGDLGE
jgi:hypothetical protein